MYLAVDDLDPQTISGLAADGNNHPIGSAGSELECYGHIQTYSVRRNWTQERLKRKLILLSVPTVSEQGLIQMTFVANACQRLLFTCFQESSPIKISSRLRRIIANSDHVTGCGHGHAQVKIFRDRLRAT